MLPSSSQYLLFTVTDERAVPDFVISHTGSSDPHLKELHKYPFAGKENVKVRLAVVEALNDQSKQDEEKFAYMELGGSDWEGAVASSEYYLARAGWWPDGFVMAQVMNREQTVLQLLRLNPVSGARTVVLEERCGVAAQWVNLHDMLHMFSPSWRPPGDHSAGDMFFLWASARSGFCQLYLYKHNALSGLTSCLNDSEPVSGPNLSEWVVDSVDAVDEVHGIVYFSGSREGCTEKHLYRASLTKSPERALQRLSEDSGWHTSTVDVTRGMLASSSSSISRCPSLSLYSLPPADDWHSYALSGREILRASDRSIKELALISSLPLPNFFSIVSSPLYLESQQLIIFLA